MKDSKKTDSVQKMKIENAIDNEKVHAVQSDMATSLDGKAHNNIADKAKDLASDLGHKAADGVKDAAEKITSGMDGAEAKLDDAVNKATAKVEGMIPDSAKEGVKKAESAAVKVAGIVDDAAHKVDEAVDSLLPERVGSDLTFDAIYEERVSRLFIFRLLRIIPMYFVIVVYSFIAGIASVIHWFYMLLLGRRNKFLWTVWIRFGRTYAKRGSYILGNTDKRPEIIEE